jgi:hypothetical protein
MSNPVVLLRSTDTGTWLGGRTGDSKGRKLFKGRSSEPCSPAWASEFRTSLWRDSGRCSITVLAFGTPCTWIFCGTNKVHKTAQKINFIKTFEKIHTCF